MPRGVLLVALALTVAGCATSNETSTSSELATASRSPVATAPPTASPSTPTDQPAGSLPAGCSEVVDLAALIAITQADVVTPPVVCYGDAPLTFVANWVGGGVADCPAAPEPAWLACSAFSLGGIGNTQKVGAAPMFVAVDPALRTLPEPGTDVEITGQFDHPAAQTCRETGSMPGESPAPVEEMIERCRNYFVVTEVTEATP